MKKYDKEFKKEAVKKYLDGQSVASISRESGVNENTIHKWKKEILSVNGEIEIWINSVNEEERKKAMFIYQTVRFPKVSEK